MPTNSAIASKSFAVVSRGFCEYQSARAADAVGAAVVAERQQPVAVGAERRGGAERGAGLASYAAGATASATRAGHSAGGHPTAPSVLSAMSAK